MSKALWYVHLQGQSIGPLSSANVTLMLQQNRLQFVDFIWAEHLTKWHRISDLDQFAALMPQYPKAGIPDVAGSANGPKASYVVEPALQSAPAPQPTPAPAPKAPAEKVAGKSPVAEKSWPKVRKSHRAPTVGAKAHIKGLGTFNALNVAEGGVFLASDKPPPLGGEVALELELPGVEKKLDMTGVVIRHGEAEKKSGFAIAFKRLNPAHKREICNYIAARTKG